MLRLCCWRIHVSTHPSILEIVIAAVAAKRAQNIIKIAHFIFPLKSLSFEIYSKTRNTLQQSDWPSRNCRLLNQHGKSWEAIIKASIALDTKELRLCQSFFTRADFSISFYFYCAPHSLYPYFFQFASLLFTLSRFVLLFSFILVKKNCRISCVYMYLVRVRNEVQSQHSQIK